MYKIVDNVDNSENRRKYRKIAVNKNVRNYLAKRLAIMAGSEQKKTLWKKGKLHFPQGAGKAKE